MVPGANRVEQEYGTRYIRIEPDDPYREYRDLERLVATIKDASLQEQLWDAIRGRRAFRHFIVHTIRSVLPFAPSRNGWYNPWVLEKAGGFPRM